MATRSRAGSLFRPALITFMLLLVLLAFDASDLDMRLARWFGNAQGFPLTEHWLLTDALHDGGRLVAWLLAMCLTLAVWWPVGWLRRLHTRERVQLIATALLSVLLVSSLKAFSTTSCPWDLAAFGGVARHVSHWSWLPDGGSGRCFPAGHASSGFAFIGGYFVWRRHSMVMARRWLVLALLAGFTLGLGQQLRGAHFMSHTLWTGWLCWSLALAVEAVLLARLSGWRVLARWHSLPGPRRLPRPVPAPSLDAAALAPRRAGSLPGGSGSSSTSP
jgi:membrane-associated PAP2 superfamily phosphatase